MIQKIIFDLDGTLVNTLGGIAGACNYVLSANGFKEVAIDRYNDYVGNGLAMTIFRALPMDIQKKFLKEHHLTMEELLYEVKGEIEFEESHKIHDYISELTNFYEEHPLLDTFLFEGIEAVLDQLDEAGIEWGIHTNKSKSIALKIADHYFGHRNYLGLEGPGANMKRKPDPEGSEILLGPDYNKDEVLFIGDTEVDLITAQNLGVKSVCVTWGFRKAEFLESLNPDFLLHKPVEILSLIEKLNKKGLPLKEKR